jgi:hypothetical protein
MARYQRRQSKSGGWRNQPATAPQYEWVERVAQEHIVPLAILNAYEAAKAEGKITKGNAGSWAEIFAQAEPLPLTAEEQHASEPGLYEFDGVQYEAKFNRKTGRLNVFHAATGEYAKGIAPRLKVKHKLAGVAA